MPSAFGHAELVPEDLEEQIDTSMRSSTRPSTRRHTRDPASGPPSSRSPGWSVSSKTSRPPRSPRPLLSSLVQTKGKALVLAAQSLFVVFCFFILLQHGLQLSEAHASIAPGLRQGWLPGRLVDLSDAQWRGFRESIAPMAVAFGVFGGVSRLVFGHRAGHGGTTSASPRGRVAYLVASSVGFLLYLHGRCALYVYGLVSLSWVLTRWLKGAPLPSGLKTLLVWVWHVGVLMVVKGTDGFSGTARAASSASWLWPLGAMDEALSGGLQWLLGRVLSRGVFRWHVCYNITMLRLISQSLDILWREDEGKVEKADRTDGKEAEEGGYWLAVAHAVYPPLYLAGPIITYSDFVSQVTGSSRAGSSLVGTNMSRSISATGAATERVTTYALRTAFDVLAIELMSHYLYFNTIATNNLLTKHAVTSATPLDVATCGWWVLAFTWLKFCVIWRFFRLAALVEGISPPENMRKCFAMNYDVQGFWKNWHASFNRWLVKYMYVPAGGSRYQLIMVWPIFIFVALWHDVEIRLLGWAGLMILAFMPELLVKRAFARPRWDWVRQEHPTALWIAKSIAATATISSLMVGNMVGFVVGLDGVGAFLTQLLGSPMLVTVSLVSFFSAASLMLTFEEWIYWAR